MLVDSTIYQQNLEKITFVSYHKGTKIFDMGKMWSFTEVSYTYLCISTDKSWQLFQSFNKSTYMKTVLTFFRAVPYNRLLLPLLLLIGAETMMELHRHYSLADY